MDRVSVRLSVLQCTACSLHTTCTAPVPFRGPSPARLAIVAEAPGRVEDEQGKPLIGPSGVKLQEWLTRAKIDPSTVAYLNAVSCFPNRTPSTKEVDVCRTNLMTQLSVIRPEFMLVMGGVALSSFWSGLRMGDARGKWWRAVSLERSLGSRVWSLSTYHPAAVLRNSSLDGAVMSDVMKVKIAMMTGMKSLVARSPSYRCVMCGGYADVFRLMDGTDVTNDVDCEGSLGWCAKHDGLRMGTAGKGRAKAEGTKASRSKPTQRTGGTRSSSGRTRNPSTRSTKQSTGSAAAKEQGTFNLEKYRVK